MAHARTMLTERLLLRPGTPADAATLFPIVSDGATMHWWSAPPLETVEALAASLEPQGGTLAWSICLEGQPIGRILLRDRGAGVAELGYVLAREQWGRGLAREAISAVIAHGFDAMALRRIFADTDADNAGSVGVLAALGFVLEGRLREARETPAGVRDSLIFGLLRRDWAARQPS